MQYTTHYNLNLPEGTDIVNPLVQDNPNYSAIDAAMFANKQAVIGTASEIVSGTVHAITRSNTDSDYFKFTATGNWTSGDTMTVDGSPVSVYLSDGTTPASGAYIINTEVLALLSGSRVTLILSAGKVNAANVSYDNTVSGLTATNTQAAIDEIVAKITQNSVSVTADGVKTDSELLDNLFSILDITKVSGKSYLMISNQVFNISQVSLNNIVATRSNAGNARAVIDTITIKISASTVTEWAFNTGGNTKSDESSNIRSAGDVIALYY